MKLKKRDAAMPEEPSESQETPSQTDKPGGKKPVVVYIMVLFIAAFLLMSLSFLMHQRSNSEVLGQLETSVSALQTIQAVQDENLQLQEELTQAQEYQESLKSDLASREMEIILLQDRQNAMLSLYTLMQQYANGEYDACRQTVQDMENSGAAALLSDLDLSAATDPAQRYQELKEAIMAH